MRYVCSRCFLGNAGFTRAAWYFAAVAVGLWFGLAPSPARTAELWIGAASADIAPGRPVPLTGNTTVRIGREIRSRLKANVLVLESRSGQKPLDHAILVACDLCVIRPGIQEGFRKHLAGRLPGADLSKLFLAAWLEYVEATVARYKKVVNEWEIWNEPFGQGQDDAIKPVGMLEYESNSPRKLTVAAFEKARTSVALGWYTDQVPRDELAWDRITVTVKGVTFRNPVCVEMITGKVYELDKSAWTSAGGSPKSLSENRDWDPSFRCLSRFSDRQ